MGKKKPSKGFKRSDKEWEESIAGHIGKLVDRLSFDDLMAIIVGGWAAYTFKSPGHFLWGSIGYKLARTPGGGGIVGSPSQIAGLITLAALGLCSIPAEAIEAAYVETLPERPEWYPDLPKILGLPRFR